MAERRFPYERNTWEPNPEAKRRWFEVLETMGPENVRVILAFDVHGSGAALGIGTEIMIKGFAQEWLAWQDRQESLKEIAFRENLVHWTRWAAIAATTAVAVSTVGWLVALWFYLR